MNEEEQKLSDAAVEYVKANKKELIAEFAPPSICHSVGKPVSLFMAGSPGAGKTEVSKGLIGQFNDTPIRIDADDIRAFCPGYSGINAHVFQRAASKGVTLLYDYALANKCNCILDGTFAYGAARENIERSLSRGRRVEIWFIFQDPVKAWEFTKVREEKETRHVSKEVFIKAFRDSRLNVKTVKEEFKDQVQVNVLTKDYAENTEDVRLNVNAEELDRLTRGGYSLEELDNILI